MAVRMLCALLILGCMPPATALTTASQAGMKSELQMFPKKQNPIRPIIKMLKDMRKANLLLDDKEEKAAEKAYCDCKASIAYQKKIVEELSAGLPELEAAVRVLKSSKKRVEAEIKKIEEKIDLIERSIEDAKALFEKENGSSQQEIDDYMQNINAIDTAIKALDNGINGKRFLFLQTQNAEVLRNLITSETAQLTDVQREMLGSFLAEDNGDQDANDVQPDTAQIIGMLRQLRDTMEINLAKVRSGFTSALEAHQKLLAEKQKQIEELNDQKDFWEKKLALIQRKLTMKERAIEDIMNGGYRRERERLEFLIETCAATAKAFRERKEWRQEELAVLTDVINILDTDDALDTFKKTLKPVYASSSSASFLQMQAVKKRVNEARRVLQSLPSGHYFKIDFIEMAISKRLVDFRAVNKMIDDLVKELKKLAYDEEHHYTKCQMLLVEYGGDIESYKKMLEELALDIKDLQSQADDLARQIKEKKDEIHHLDTDMNSSRAIRLEEHSLYMQDVAMDTKAMDLLTSAKSRMSEFYEALLQVNGTSHAAEDARQKDHQKVIFMLKKLIAGLQNEMIKNNLEEQARQKAHDQEEEINLQIRLGKRQELDGLEGEKAIIDGQLFDKKIKEDRAKKHQQKVIDSLGAAHMDCDWLIANYDERKKARQGEIDSLQTAKAVLAGADVDTFLQEEQQQHRAQRMLRGSK